MYKLYLVNGITEIFAIYAVALACGPAYGAPIDWLRSFGNGPISIVDSGGRVPVWTLAGAPVSTIDSDLSKSGGLAFDARNRTLLIGRTNSVTAIDLSGNQINDTFAPGAFYAASRSRTPGAPGPATVFLATAGLGAFLLMRKSSVKPCLLVFALCSLICFVPSKSAAAVTNLKLTSNVPSPQPLGTVVFFQASSDDTVPPRNDYQYWVKGPLDSSFQMVRDFSGYGSLNWAPIEHEGTFEIQVVGRDKNAGQKATTSMQFTLTSRVTGNKPTVNITPHPLVALYSAPACPAGFNMQVRFIQSGQTNWTSTSLKPCVAGYSMNFYIAGMYANSVYYLQHGLINGPFVTKGPVLVFPTGTATIAKPATTVNIPPVPPSFVEQPILLHSYISINPTQPAFAFATDLNGKTLWYDTTNSYSIVRTVPGGTFLALASFSPLITQTHVLRQIDLAGNTLRETNASVVSEQLVARGIYPISQFHHDALILPNGYTVVLGTTERVFSNVQGATGAVDILGDTIVVLDQNFQLVWAWSIFDHLDVNSKAPLGETCVQGQGGCGFLFTPVNGTANDWTHSNAIDYTPSDGSLLLSVRDQDKIIKINYANGTGDGRIIWTLGPNGGDFKINGISDPSPWFTHQHNVNYVDASGNFIVLFDNGNTRVTQAHGVGHSRGQLYQLDQVNKVATLIVNKDLGVYSGALGTAEKLLNGNYHFMAGGLNLFGGGLPASEIFEFSPSGSSPSYSLQSANFTYRTFRMQTLYAQ